MTYPTQWTDRVVDTTTTTGTGTYSAAGAISGFQAISATPSGVQSAWFVTDEAANWEVLLGTPASGTPWTLSRDTILASTNGGAAVNWGAGTKQITNDVPAAWFMSPAFATPAATDNSNNGATTAFVAAATAQAASFAARHG